MPIRGPSKNGSFYATLRNVDSVLFCDIFPRSQIEKQEKKKSERESLYLKLNQKTI